MVRDFEAVTCDDRGDIQKPSGTPYTHLSDGIGYYIADRYPVGGSGYTSRRVA